MTEPAVPAAREGAAATLLSLYRTLSRERRRRLFLVIGATGLGTLAELAAIGAVVPFLALLSDPARAQDIPGWSLFAGLTGDGSHGAVARNATILLIVAAVAAASARLLILRLTLNFVLMTGHDFASGVFARALRQPYRRHVERNSAELLGSVEKLHFAASGAIMPLVQVPVAAVMALAIAILLLVINPVAAASGIGALGLFYLVVARVLRRQLHRSSLDLSDVATARMKTLQETMGSMRDIILDDTQPVFEAEYRRLDLRFRLAQRRGQFAGAAPRFLAEALGITLIGVLALVMSMEQGGLGPSLPLLGALALGAQRMMPLLQQIHQGTTSLKSNLALLQDMIALLRVPIVEPSAHRPAPLPFDREIRLDQVGFRFGTGREWALSGISLTIPAGARVAVVGRTGSGKSTFFDLLMGLLDPDKGVISIDGAPLNEHNRAAWQRQIAHVPQSIYLTDRSIAANIAFGVGDEAKIELERVREAACKAQIHAFIEALPAGYDTPVGERGVKLSGGERQRIAIARALYRGARLLILDEATAALDERTEEALMEAVGAADPKLTILVATHRLSALSWCERVVTFEAGSIVNDRRLGTTNSTHEFGH
jgi:ABC-type multidrug transport system fused ATPase/permease subunit